MSDIKYKNQAVIEIKNCIKRNITDAKASVVYTTSENKEARQSRTKNVNPEISDIHIFESIMGVVMRLLKPRP